MKQRSRAYHKRYRFIFIVLIISIAFVVFGFFGLKEIKEIQRKKILDSPLQKLTQEEKLEDFEYLYKVITENYPFLEVNKRLHGIEWAEVKEEYIDAVKESQRDYEFYNVLQSALEDLNNGHTQMLGKKQVKDMRGLYYQTKQEGNWQGINYDILDHPKVLQRYNILDESPVIKKSNEAQSANLPYENAQVKDIIKNCIGYIWIPQMISPWDMDLDIEVLNEYIKKIENYEALVIDIRGNGGGDTRYWQNYLIPAIIDKPYSDVTYCLWKDGELIQSFFKANRGFKALKVQEFDRTKLTMLPEEIEQSFTYYSKFTTTITPSDTSICFKGNIYLLVDNAVYSSAEALAVFAKGSGLATLIGETTGGDGIGSDPLLAMLPNSGYVFRFSKDMGIASDGSCNEEKKTSPHYIIKSPQKVDFKEDLCIRKVLELEGY